MTRAILKLEGSDQIEGDADAGGDYVRLLVDGLTDTGVVKTAARGEIEIEGTTSDVVLENSARHPRVRGPFLRCGCSSRSDKGASCTMRPLRTREGP